MISLMPKPRRSDVAAVLRRGSIRAVSGALTAAITTLEVAADISPGLRITRRRRIPRNLGAGILGAEVTSWMALSPSLLPRRWWATAANVAVCQAVGHASLSGLAWALNHLPRRSRFPLHTELTTASRSATHLSMAAITAMVTARSLQRQKQQARLINAPISRGARQSLVGIGVGTAGYGLLLVLGDLTQYGVDRAGGILGRLLPEWLGWLGWLTAAAAAGCLVALLSNQVLVRHFIADFTRKAEELNQLVFTGVTQPWEPERTGSPWSLEPWHAVGAQGRALLSGGPRARDIAVATGLPRSQVHEPIRIFAGMVPGRSLSSTADVVLAEMDRTGAFHRETLVIQTSTGTGWIADWSIGAVEFLTGGNCATMSMQYSYISSAVSYHIDKEPPVRAAQILIGKILGRLEDMPNPPKVYVAGESLGAYGSAAAFEDLDDLLARTDGAVFTGAPRFTEMIRELTRNRDSGSPERLPLVDGGRHVRFAAHPSHLHHDYAGLPYRRSWRHPRVVIGQHASDPIVWFDAELIYRRPDWLREIGTRGVRAPQAQRLDVLPSLRWYPFVTAWQIGLDMLISTEAPGGHGHNYHGEVFHYWAAVLGERPGVPVQLTPALYRKMERWVEENHIRR